MAGTVTSHAFVISSYKIANCFPNHDGSKGRNCLIGKRTGLVLTTFRSEGREPHNQRTEVRGRRSVENLSIARDRRKDKGGARNLLTNQGSCCLAASPYFFLGAALAAEACCCFF